MNQQDKIEAGVNKIEHALRAALGSQLDEQMYATFATCVRKMLTYGDNTTAVNKADGATHHMTLESFMEQLTPDEQKTFFRNLLDLEEPLEPKKSYGVLSSLNNLDKYADKPRTMPDKSVGESDMRSGSLLDEMAAVNPTPENIAAAMGMFAPPIPGRFAVEHRIDMKVADKDQAEFWGRSFLSMLARLAITQEAFQDRLQEDLAGEYHDNFRRTVNFSEITKVFMDQRMSYEHYLYCAKLLGFTHVKVELI